MNDSPPETSELLAFVEVVGEGSVSAAARQLGLPRSTISRRLARLEERLDVRLLHRTTRQLHLTESGEEYLVHARAVLQAIEEATSSVRRSTDLPKGLLRVSVPPVLSVELRATLLDFLDRYPDVKLELIASAVSEDLRAQNIDVAWRATTELAPDLIARKLFKSPVTAVAAPAYLAQRGAPKSPADLAAHSCLRGFARGIRPTTHWPLTDGGSVRVKGRLVANDLLILYDAALRGDGIALLPETWSGVALADCRLVRVLPDQLGVMAQVALVYPNRRLLKPAVRAFVDFVAPRAAQFSMGPRALR